MTDTKEGTGEVNRKDLLDRDADVISSDGGSDPDDVYGGQSETPYGGVEDKTRGAGRIRRQQRRGRRLIADVRGRLAERLR